MNIEYQNRREIARAKRIFAEDLFEKTAAFFFFVLSGDNSLEFSRRLWYTGLTEQKEVTA
ncbi:MAG: hypothetical protein IJU52_00395 [Clostridia bacterium]|nr:hypothetical protein [Clostridia bacterium]